MGEHLDSKRAGWIVAGVLFVASIALFAFAANGGFGWGAESSGTLAEWVTGALTAVALFFAGTQLAHETREARLERVDRYTDAAAEREQRERLARRRGVEVKAHCWHRILNGDEDPNGFDGPYAFVALRNTSNSILASVQIGVEFLGQPTSEALEKIRAGTARGQSHVECAVAIEMGTPTVLGRSDEVPPFAYSPAESSMSLFVPTLGGEVERHVYVEWTDETGVSLRKVLALPAIDDDQPAASRDHDLPAVPQVVTRLRTGAQPTDFRREIPFHATLKSQ